MRSKSKSKNDLLSRLITLTPGKGWKFTIDAFTKAQEVNLEDIPLIIAGDGSMRDCITEKLSTLTPHTY